MSESFAAEIHLLNAEAGGRVGPLPSGEWRTVLGINNEQWSARLLFDGSPKPGESFLATVQLLVPEAKQYFPAGAEFTVWERGTKGEGHVLPAAL
ncbi:hypothetical protein PEC18_07850 [Paucibacter sp. O1-1]|uniref:hypothetical protein n=1 Tax=Roseateles cavernae TaxID=3153578 RepID=UPI0021D50C84|nr:hypothetical protein [Paucibacter sp. O1-1]MDA3825779.1 hypothetical protein [Paucibacter sp. O1-1]